MGGVCQEPHAAAMQGSVGVGVGQLTLERELAGQEDPGQQGGLCADNDCGCGCGFGLNPADCLS